MVKKVTPNGTHYEEPPYTEAEKADIRAALSHGPFTRARVELPATEQPRQQQAKPRRAS